MNLVVCLALVAAARAFEIVGDAFSVKRCSPSSGYGLAPTTRWRINTALPENNPFTAWLDRNIILSSWEKVMTKALDAAIRAAKEAIEDPKRYAKYEDVARAILCAALPTEPTPEVIEAMARGLARLRVQQNQEKWNRPPMDVERAVEYAWKDFVEEASAAYRALRAHLLGEDT